MGSFPFINMFMPFSMINTTYLHLYYKYMIHLCHIFMIYVYIHYNIIASMIIICDNMILYLYQYQYDIFIVLMV